MSHTDVKTEFLHELFRYDEVEGKLFWKTRPESHFATSGSCTTWNGRFAGKEVGTLHKSKKSVTVYRMTRVSGNMVLVHVIIWAMTYGEWPAMSIDHIDRDGLNNRLDNLKLSTLSEQQRNKGLCSKNKSGVKGVNWHKATGKWAASICNSVTRIHLGVFCKFEDAVQARRDAEQAYGYSPQ